MTASRYRTGLAAERLCALALRLKFYRILHRRYKTPVGEIDLLAVRGRTLVAVEVKARADHAQAAASIGPAQQARIARALQSFVMREPRYAGFDLRFDVMLALPGRWPVHIVNAWRMD